MSVSWPAIVSGLSLVWRTCLRSVSAFVLLSCLTCQLQQFVARVCLCKRRWLYCWRGRVCRGGSPGPLFVRREVWHSIFGVTFIKGFTLPLKCRAGGRRAWVGRLAATRDTTQGPVTLICAVEFTGAVSTFLSTDTCISGMPIFLAFNAPDWDVNIFADINQVIVDSYVPCQ